MANHDFQREIMLEMERDWLKDTLVARDWELWALWARLPVGELKGQLYDILSKTQGVAEDDHLITLFIPDQGDG